MHWLDPHRLCKSAAALPGFVRFCCIEFDQLLAHMPLKRDTLFHAFRANIQGWPQLEVRGFAHAPLRTRSDDLRHEAGS